MYVYVREGGWDERTGGGPSSIDAALADVRAEARVHSDSALSRQKSHQVNQMTAHGPKHPAAVRAL
jgi:hypothetical protein